MQSFLWLGPASIDGSGTITRSSNFDLLIGTSSWSRRRSLRRLCTPVVAAAAVNGQQNHYAVLGVSPTASSSDIKKAYRLLARKYHPDVSKDSRADEVFKSIRLAYEILSNDTTRNQYDRAVLFRKDSSKRWTVSFNYDIEFEDGIRAYRWAGVRQRMQGERYWEWRNAQEQNSSLSDEETPEKERGSFIEVLRSAFLSLFLMQTIGSRLSLTFSSLMALLDPKLDAGYKAGYVIAWLLGGKGGILLTLCLSFASWVCGKTSSSIVALVVVAMWVGSNLARFAPLPQGALLTLLYMSIKLQVDLN